MTALVRIKDGKNFIVYRNGEDGDYLIKMDGIRFSYPHFGHKQQQEGEDGSSQESYGGVAMLPKATHAEARAAFVEIMKGLLEKNKVDGKPAVVAPENRCLKDGDDKEDENMHGHWLITFKDQKNKPGVRDQKGAVMTDPDEIDNKFYGGCWGSVLLRPWFFSGTTKNKPGKKYPKRLCAGFTGVAFMKDDKPFGQGRVDDTEAWGTPTGGSGGSKPFDDEDDDF